MYYLFYLTVILTEKRFFDIVLKYPQGSIVRATVHACGKLLEIVFCTLKQKNNCWRMA